MISKNYKMRKISQFLVLLMFALALVANIPGCFGQPADREYRLSRDAFGEGIRRGVLLEFDEAIEYFDRAISLDSTYSEAFLYRGLAYYELMQYEQSLNDLTKAYWLDARLEDQIHFYLGHVKAALHDFYGAIDHLTKAIQTDPDHAAYFERGKSFYCLLLYDTALIDFNASLRLNPNMFDALFYRAKTYFFKNDLDKALQDFYAYSEKNINDTIAQYYINYIERILTPQQELAELPDDTFVTIDYEDDTDEVAINDKAVKTDNDEESGNSYLDSDEEPVADITPSVNDNADKDTIPGTADNDFPVDSETYDETETYDVTEADDITEADYDTESDDDAETKGQEVDQKDITALDEGFYDVNLKPVNPRGMGVQIVTLSQKEHILETIASYEQQFGHPVYINISGFGTRRLFRIVIGSFVSRDEALALRSRLREHGYSDSFIISYP